MQLFTVVTICYNSEKYLQQTMESVASQTFTDYEHLIWDGGSQDRTLEIAARYPRVRIEQGKDRGISDAMNKGAERARGRFLLFIHSDDLLGSPHSLAMWASAIGHYPQAHWFYGRAKMIDAQGELLRTTPIEFYTHRRLRKYNFITHQSTLMSKVFHDELGGFNPELKYCMDYDLWLRAAKKRSPILVPAILSQFREHAASNSIGNPFRVADEAYQIRNRYVRTPLERLRSYRTWKKRRRVGVC